MACIIKKLLFQEPKALTRRGLGWNSLTPISRTGKPSRCVLSCQVWRWSIGISQNESNRQTALFTYFGSAGKRQKRKALALLFHPPPHTLNSRPPMEEQQARVKWKQKWGEVISLPSTLNKKRLLLYGPVGPQQGRRGKTASTTVPDNEVSVEVLGKCLAEAP